VAATLGAAAITGTLIFAATSLSSTSSRGTRIASMSASVRAALASLVVTPGAIFPHSTVFTHGTHSFDQPASSQECQALESVNCYTPNQIQQGYELLPLYGEGITGKGTTIVVVDPYGSPTIAADVDAFSSGAGLPGARLDILQPVGAVPPFDQTNPDELGWAGETTLDVEYAHAIAPGAAIDLIEVPNDELLSILTGVQYAITHRLGDVISQSFGWPEVSIRPAIEYIHRIYVQAVRNRITVLASAGDQGATSAELSGDGYYGSRMTIYPATDPDVTAIGGTSLNLGPDGNRLSPDVVWNDTYNLAANQVVDQDNGPNPLATGGGRSELFRRPAFQNGVKNVVGDWRGIPDISMSASCSNAVQVYLAFAGIEPGWTAVCGTSESAPIFAGIVALADQKAGHSLGLINPALYELAARDAKGIVRVTSGNNTVAFINNDEQTVTVHGFYARNGYSLTVGLGTINGQYFVPELASAGPVKPVKPVKKKHHSLCEGQARLPRS
jgi:subtilase family serine protease